MKLSCTYENLTTTLGYLEWVVGRQSHLPILSNILFEAENGRLRLFATNLEIGVIAELGAKVESGGKVALPAKLLSQFVQNLDPNEIIHISQDGAQVSIENGKDKIMINSIESKDFPLIPEYTSEYPLQISTEIFSEALKKVLFAVSTNESRVELTGVYLTKSERGIHVVATDSFRLSEVTLSDLSKEEKTALEMFLKEQGGIILPTETLQELNRILQRGDMLSLAVKDNQVYFEINGIKIVSRIIQGRYPDYQQILPQKFRMEVAIPKGELIRSLKMAVSFAQYGSGEVQCCFHKDSAVLEIITTSVGIGEQRTKISLPQTFEEDMILIFQPRHILEGVNALPGTLVTFHLNTKDMPVLLTGENIGEQLYLVMPIRK